MTDTETWVYELFPALHGSLGTGDSGPLAQVNRAPGAAHKPVSPAGRDSSSASDTSSACSQHEPAQQRSARAAPDDRPLPKPSGPKRPARLRNSVILARQMARHNASERDRRADEREARDRLAQALGLRGHPTLQQVLDCAQAEINALQGASTATSYCWP